MASKYDDFMNKGNISRFPSGKEQVAACHSLSDCWDDDIDNSPERMERLKKTLMESKTGRQTLEFLEKNKTDIVFGDLDGCYGCYFPGKNKVILNPVFSDESIAVTLVHEGRHAWQYAQIGMSLDMTPQASLTSRFASEADACTAQVSFVHEMRQTHPEIWEDHQETPYAKIGKEFEKTFEKTGDVNQARASAFMQWYDTSVKTIYEEKYVAEMSNVAKKLVKDEKLDMQFFSEECSAKHVVDTMCRDYDGTPYLTDSKALENPSLKKEYAVSLSKAFVPYMDKYKKTSEQLGFDKISISNGKEGQKNCKEAVDNIRNKKNSSIFSFFFHKNAGR